MNFLHSFVFLLSLFLISVHLSDEACTNFPTALQSGTWYASDMGTVSFNATHFSTTKIVDFGALTFECQNSVGDRYYSLSSSFSYLNNDFKVAICFNLVSVSDYMYYYYPLSDILDSTLVHRVIFQLATYSFTEAETCANSYTNASNFRALVRDGYINQTAQTCNNGVLGQYAYTFSGYSGCNNTFLDVCTTNTDPTFNYTACANETSFSATGVFSCVYSEDYGSYGYQIVYNQDNTTDESTYYRFACWMYSYVYNTTYMTMYPKACLDNQTATYVISPGQTLTMVSSLTCPVSSETDDTETFSAGAVVAVVLALILIVIAIVIMLVVYYFKVHKAKKAKIQPADDMIATKSPPLDTKDDGKKDGRVSPFSPYPTISEIAVYRFGPEPAQEIDDDDGGMTLEATTPGFTDGRRTMYKDVERESQASIPIYSEVGGETPEPTRLSEVQTRMSEVSEANITDPQPWTMTRATMNIPEETTVSPIGSPTENKPNGTVQSPRDNGGQEDVTL